MKDFLDFLRQMSQSDPLVVVLIIALVLAFAALMGGVVAYYFLRRELKRDEATKTKDDKQDQIISAFLTLANSLSAQGERSTTQQAQQNTILDRNAATMEKLTANYIEQQKTIHDMLVSANETVVQTRQQTERIGELTQSATAMQANLDKQLQMFTMQHENRGKEHNQITAQVESVQKDLTDKFQAIKTDLEHLEALLGETKQKIEDLSAIKGQVDNIVNVVTTLVNRLTTPPAIPPMPDTIVLTELPKPTNEGVN